jgi:threonine dehydrogenase-like Zn-dependent dehydrogenase
MALIERRIVHVARCITHRFPLDEIRAAIQAAESHEGLKVMVKP